MAESLHEQIVAAIETSLGGIQEDGGDTYWYAPQAVTRISWEDPRLLDSSVSFTGPIYAIRPGEEQHTEATSGEVVALAPIHVLLIAPFRSVESPLAPADPSRATVVNRMVRDVLRKLLADVQLGAFGLDDGRMENIFDGPAVVDRDRYHDTWALAEIIFTVKYSYVGGIP